MADVKWIKLATQVFDNRKIKQIERMPDGDSIIVVWIKLLCLAGTANKNGMIFLTEEIPYTEDMLVTEFNMEQRASTLKLALRTFEQFGMIEIIDNIFYISSWEKYQNIEGLEKIRKQTRERVAKHRNNQKMLECNVTCNANVTPSNATELDKEQDIDIDKDIKDNRAKTSRFTPPTLEEVKAYCKERNNNVDAERFIDFYSSKGWMIGKNKMKDWKACVRTWERESKGRSVQNGQAGLQANGDNELDCAKAFAERFADEPIDEELPFMP